MLTLQGRTAVFTGGTGYVGRGAVKKLVEGGMNVVLVTHNFSDCQQLVESFKHLDNGNRCIMMSNDIPRAEIYRLTYERYGSLDVIISNGGKFSPTTDVKNVTKEEFDAVTGRGYGLIRLAVDAIPYLEKSKAGRIIYTTSASACVGFNGESILDAYARGGERSIALYLSRLLAPKRITVNCIEKSAMINDHDVKPGDFDTRTLIPSVPMGRLGTTEEFGAAVAYLASEEAGFVTGQVLHVSGGLALGK